MLVIVSTLTAFCIVAGGVLGLNMLITDNGAPKKSCLESIGYYSKKANLCGQNIEEGGPGNIQRNRYHNVMLGLLQIEEKGKKEGLSSEEIRIRQTCFMIIAMDKSRAAFHDNKDITLDYDFEISSPENYVINNHGLKWLSGTVVTVDGSPWTIVSGQVPYSVRIMDDCGRTIEMHMD
ncbi:MAG: hypothetical protein LBJ32_03155 [Oscillospiraceae bacterium]|jgi:hypothetical protein|nr:hypothetical protein [Oscillospiraceae bacterium]